jgi:hypothetical protein
MFHALYLVQVLQRNALCISLAGSGLGRHCVCRSNGWASVTSIVGPCSPSGRASGLCLRCRGGSRSWSRGARTPAHCFNADCNLYQNIACYDCSACLDLAPRLKHRIMVSVELQPMQVRQGFETSDICAQRFADGYQLAAGREPAQMSSGSCVASWVSGLNQALASCSARS